MKSRTNSIAFKLTMASLAAVPILLFADVNGAEPRLTNAPGDTPGACTNCHIGTALNGGAGSVQIILPGDATYTPGARQHIQVRVADPAQRRWGFELSARIDTNPTSGQAGDLASTDSNTRAECANGRAKPCSASSPLQFITHTQAGARLGTTGGATFEFDWTAPASDVGTVTLYAAGNAANGNNSETGDHIYTTKVTLSPAAVNTAPAPQISSAQGVVNAASFQPSVAPNSWVTIQGANLATTTRLWSAADMQNGSLPTSLDGVNVTIDGQPAYVEYVSPTQINVLAPSDSALGPVDVKVTVNGQSSAPASATLQSYSPAFFAATSKYLAATHADNTLVGAAGLFPQAPNATTPAKPGETIILYGAGFGPTSPSIPSGRMTDRLASTTEAPVITIGGVQANVSFAGLIPGYAGLYQFNVEVPATLGDGDQAVSAAIGGASSPSGTDCCYITVQR